MIKKLPIYKLTIAKDDLESGVSAIALVEEPAIEIDFFAFAKEDKPRFEFKAVNEDKQVLAGYLMVPDKLIYRRDDQNEYFVMFDKDTISNIAEKFNRNKNTSNFNTEHQSSNALSNVFVKENWIVESPDFDKSKMYGFEPILGAWFGVVKIDDKNIWNEFVKTGQVKGFSVEGNFAPEYYSMIEESFKAKQPIRVGFDFDNTLSLLRGQELAKEELAKGNQVFIITGKDKSKSKRVYKVAQKLGIPTSNVHFTLKNKIADTIKGLKLDMWYDNDQKQLDFVAQNTGIKTVKFESLSPFTNYFKKLSHQ